MGIRDDFQKRIDRKQQEISEFELKIREAKAYIQALQDSIRSLLKEAIIAAPTLTLRPGSSVYKARLAIKKSRKPMHITEILAALGLPNDKKHRLALSGTIASYARKNQIFIKTYPNTFGLLELGHSSQDVSLEPPPDFGMDSEQEEEIPTEETPLEAEVPPRIGDS